MNAAERPFDPTPAELEYPAGYLVRKVLAQGSVKVANRRINVSSALRGWNVGLEPIRDQAVYGMS